jgi:hypothetical protein
VERNTFSFGKTDTSSAVDNDFPFISQALAQGLFMNVAEYHKENDYRTVSSRSDENKAISFSSSLQINDRHLVKIHPSSVLFGAKPSLVVFTELIQTTKRFIR